MPASLAVLEGIQNLVFLARPGTRNFNKIFDKFTWFYFVLRLAFEPQSNIETQQDV